MNKTEKTGTILFVIGLLVTIGGMSMAAMGTEDNSLIAATISAMGGAILGMGLWIWMD